MIKKILLLASVSIMVAGCNKIDIVTPPEDQIVGNADDSSFRMVEVVVGGKYATSKATRNSVVYGLPFDLGESFRWDPDDRISLFIEGQPGNSSTLAAKTTEDKEAYFHGSVPLMSGPRTIYAVSPDLIIESLDKDIIHTFPAIQVQENQSTKHACMSAIFYARSECNIPSNGSLDDVSLSFRPLSSMFRVQVKNGDPNKSFRVVSVRLSESGPDPQLFDRVTFNLSDQTPTLKGLEGSATSPKLLKVIDALMMPPQTGVFDAYILVPPAAARISPDSRFVIEVTVEDQDGNESTRQLDLACTEHPFLASGFASGSRYYAQITIKSSTFDRWQNYTKIDLQTAGTITSAPNFSEGIEALKLLGVVDSHDFSVIKDMKWLTVLDLTDVNVVGGAIPDDAFNNMTSLSSVQLPQSITRIGVRAFRSTSIAGSLEIPRKVTSIGNLAFANCYSLSGTLTLPAGLATIGNHAFYGCLGLVGSLTLPDGLLSIGENAFNGCTGFTGRLTIPASVSTIGESAFQDCVYLDRIYFEHTTPIAFAPGMLPIGVSVYVPASALDAYRSAPDWSGMELNGY